MLDDLFGGWIAPDEPGLVVAVSQDGAVTHQAAYGLAELAHGTPLGPRTVLRIGSQTKQFTVLLALLLEREGRLSLEDEVHRHAPWLAPTPTPVTLRRLAANTSGLRDFLELLTWSGSVWPAPSTRADLREILGRHGELNFAPGEQMLYSNTGFLLLGEIVERLADAPLGELIRERLTGPLGMHDTTLQPRDSQVLARGATHHTRGADGSWERAHWGLELGGEGGLSSTLEDMLRWQAFLTDPPEDIAPLLGRMATPERFPDGSPAMYGLGLCVTRYRGMTNVGHGGGVAGGRSESVRFPEAGLGVVILGNRDDLAPYALARRIADRVIADRLDPAPDPAALASLAGAAGMWRQEEGDDVIEIVAGGGAPQLGADPSAPLLVTSGGAVTIEQREDGSLAPERPTTHLTLGPPRDGVLPARWCGVPRRYRPVRRGAGRLDRVAGAYACPSLGVDAVVDEEARRLTVRSDHGALRLSLAWLEPDLLVATPPPSRAPGAGWDAVLRVTDDGLVLTSDRTKGLLLRRVTT
jgi:CubicO group peptidase (beta-lactamase class C family)